MAALADRVKETTTTTGTGAVTLAGAVSGFRAFSAAFTSGAKVYYCIEGQVPGEWEVGIGTFTTTLSRDTVLGSSNAGALVNFSAGTKNVFCTAPGTAITPGVNVRTTPYTITGSDYGKVVVATSTCSYINLPLIADVGVGFTVTVINKIPSANVPVSRQGSDNLTLSTARHLQTYQSATFIAVSATTWDTFGQTMYSQSPGGILLGGTGAGMVAGNQALAFGDGSSAGDFTIALGKNSSGQGAQAVNGGAVALAGSYAAGNDSFAVAGATNSSTYGALSLGAVAAGNLARGSAAHGVALGNKPTSSGTSSFSAAGGSNGSFGVTASGVGAVAFGDGALAAENGKWAYTNVTNGSVAGSAQNGMMVLYATSSGGGQVRLTSNGSVTGIASNQLAVATGKSLYATGKLIGRQQSSANVVAYDIKAVLTNNSGTLTMPTGTVTLVGADGIGLTTAPTLAVDSTNLSLAVNSGDKTATSIHWCAVLDTVEVI